MAVTYTGGITLTGSIKINGGAAVPPTPPITHVWRGGVATINYNATAGTFNATGYAVTPGPNSATIATTPAGQTNWTTAYVGGSAGTAGYPICSSAITGYGYSGGNIMAIMTNNMCITWDSTNNTGTTDFGLNAYTNWIGSRSMGVDKNVWMIGSQSGTYPHTTVATISVDLTTTTVYTGPAMPYGNGISALASNNGSGNGRWVAGGFGSTAYSDDLGATWTVSDNIMTCGFGQKFPNVILWTGSTFVAIGSGNSVATSTDGATWTNQTGLGQGGGFATTYSNTVIGCMFGSSIVAVDDHGWTAVSTDNGVTWTAGTGVQADSTWNLGSVNLPSSIASDGTNLMMGATSPTLGSNPYGIVATSTDGFNWTVSTITDYVAPLAPVANFFASPTSGPISAYFTFFDQSTNTPTSWLWNFGDGTTSTTQSPSHLYTSTGTYTVSLTATNAAGSNTLTKTNYITANPSVPTSWQAGVLTLAYSSEAASPHWFAGGIYGDYASCATPLSTSWSYNNFSDYYGITIRDMTVSATNNSGSGSAGMLMMDNNGETICNGAYTSGSSVFNSNGLAGGLFGNSTWGGLVPGAMISNATYYMIGGVKTSTGTPATAIATITTTGALPGNSPVYTVSSGPSWSTAGIYTLAVNGGTGTTWVAGGASGQLAYSTNVGVTWTNVTTLPSTSWGTAAVRNIIWTGSYFVAIGDGTVVARSTDGISWSYVGVGTSGTFSYAANSRALKYGSSILVIDQIGRIITSADNGSTWSSINTSLSGNATWNHGSTNPTNAAATDGSLVIIGSTSQVGQVAMSTDLSTWTFGTI